MKLNKTFVVAEIGSNHNNSLNNAKKIIKVAKDCGADAVKFQLFKAEKLYSKNDKRYKILTKFQLNTKWIKELQNFSKKNNVIFFASPFDKESVDILIKNKVKILKIASPEIRDDLLIEHIAKKKVFTILSTGVSTLNEIYRAKKIINKYHNKLAILQCSSIYPCDLNDLNLLVIKQYKKIFKNFIGFSDHSTSPYPAIAAVTLGAKIIEKHITLNNKQKGPDHSISIEPNEFKMMVTGIRSVEKSFGIPSKKILKKESLKNHKKSFFSKEIIKREQKLTKNNIQLLRSSKGIGNNNLQKILNKKVKKTISKGKIIKWEYLK